MPVKLGKKKYDKFSDASAAIQKKKLHDILPAYILNPVFNHLRVGS
jgi:hypothetical protein